MTQGFTYNLFCWIAGIDRGLLDACSDYEKNRQASTGLLIMMPVTLGFISMSFAIYTISEILCLSCILGLVWATFVMIIDRYLVSTYIKTEYFQIKTHSVINLFIRILFALGVGFSVSHPLVLFIFDDTIQKKIVEVDRGERDAIEVRQNKLSKADSTRLKNLDTNYENLLSNINCVNQAIENEANSLTKITITCPNRDTYTSSGNPNPLNREGPRTRNLKQVRDIMLAETRRLEIDINGLQVKLQNKDSVVLQDQNDLKKVASKDYLTRAVALTMLEADPQLGSTVSSIKLFLLIFFIFIDLIPLIFKMLMVYGEYDQKISENRSLRGYLSRYQYGVNRELGRLSIEQVFRFQRQKIRDIADQTFDSVESLITYLRKFKLWYDFSSSKSETKRDE